MSWFDKQKEESEEVLHLRRFYRNLIVLYSMQVLSKGKTGYKGEDYDILFNIIKEQKECFDVPSIEKLEERLQSSYKERDKTNEEILRIKKLMSFYTI